MSQDISMNLLASHVPQPVVIKSHVHEYTSLVSFLHLWLLHERIWNYPLSWWDRRPSMDVTRDSAAVSCRNWKSCQRTCRLYHLCMVTHMQISMGTVLLQPEWYCRHVSRSASSPAMYLLGDYKLEVSISLCLYQDLLVTCPLSRPHPRVGLFLDPLFHNFRSQV